MTTHQSNRADVAEAAWEHFQEHGFADELAEQIERDNLDLDDIIAVAWKVGFVQALLGIELGMRKSQHSDN